MKMIESDIRNRVFCQVQKFMLDVWLLAAFSYRLGINPIPMLRKKYPEFEWRFIKKLADGWGSNIIHRTEKANLVFDFSDLNIEDVGIITVTLQNPVCRIRFAIACRTKHLPNVTMHFWERFDQHPSSLMRIIDFISSFT